MKNPQAMVWRVRDSTLLGRIDCQHCLVDYNSSSEDGVGIKDSHRKASRRLDIYEDQIKHFRWSENRRFIADIVTFAISYVTVKEAVSPAKRCDNPEAPYT